MQYNMIAHYKDLQCELSNIFQYYKNKYNFKSYLCFHYVGAFSMADEYININITDLIETWENEPDIEQNRSLQKNINDYIIFVLLHEIGHIIDYIYNYDEYIKEKLNVNMDLYNLNENYHDNLEFEKRASNFAINEINNWKNKGG